MDNVQVSSTSEEVGMVETRIHEVNEDSSDTKESGEISLCDFDVSDILADYLTKKINEKTSKSGEADSSSHSTAGAESSRRDTTTSKKQKNAKRKKKDKKDRRDRRPRSRSSSREKSTDERSRKTRHERSSRKHRRHEAREHRSRGSRSGDRRKGRSRTPKRERRNSRSRSDERRGFNKSELFEVARRNVKLMLDSGTLPKGFVVDPEKMGFHKEQIVESIEKYTQMCRKIRDEDDNEPSSSHVNHPFAVKDRPIRMNIANSISLPIKSSKEKILSAQFPVSSGCSHRELEWHPVESEPPKKKTKKAPGDATNTEQLAVEYPACEPPPKSMGIQDKLELEIRSLTIPQLLNRIQEATRRLESNPFDIEAKQTQKFCEASIRELSFNSPDLRAIKSCTDASLPPPMHDYRHTAWPRRNQLRDTQALNSGIGMTLLQKMGWTPGTGIGKNQEGVLEPLLPQIKFDRKGLVAQEEISRRPPPATKRPPPATRKPQPVVNKQPSVVNSTANRSAAETAAIQQVIDASLGGKHPVTLLLEICTAKKMQQPQFIDLPPEGEPHDRTFLCRVDFHGKTFIPTVRSLTKKLAKAQAALLALADIGEYDATKHNF